MKTDEKAAQDKKVRLENRFSANRGHISVNQVLISYGENSDRNVAVEETSVEIKPQEFVCLLGPSGCGKSTLLNAIAGFVQPTQGRVSIDDILVDGPGPDRGMVFQQYSLLPWKTIFENIALALVYQMISRPQKPPRIFWIWSV